MPTDVARNSAWIQRFDSVPSGDVRLICLPHAGGAASFYHPFSRLLPSAVEMPAIQHLGRQGRRLEPCIVD